MYKSEDQKREDLKHFVAAAARDIMARHAEVAKPAAETAQAVWSALRDSPTWSVVEGPKPRDPEWTEPEEVWRMVPEVVSPRETR